MRGREESRGERAGPGAAAAAAAPAPQPRQPERSEVERKGLDRVAGPVAGKSRDSRRPARSGEGVALLGGFSAFPGGPLLLSRRPSLGSPPWRPRSRQTRRAVRPIALGGRGRVGVSGPLSEGLDPGAGASPRLADSGLGRWRPKPPPKQRQPVSLTPSSRPLPQPQKRRQPPPPKKNPPRGGGVAAAGTSPGEGEKPNLSKHKK